MNRKTHTTNVHKPRTKVPVVKETTIPTAKEDAGVGKISELIPLFRLLTREPPAEHDFRTCAICKRYGITRI